MDVYLTFFVNEVAENVRKSEEAILSDDKTFEFNLNIPTPLDNFKAALVEYNRLFRT